MASPRPSSSRGDSLTPGPAAHNGASAEPSSGPHRRSSKACETCRVRRIKCVGPPPCEGCRIAGVGSSCTVRLKARPKRAPSSKLLVKIQQEQQSAYPPVPSLFSNPLAPGDVTVGASTASANGQYAERRNPLDDIEASLAVWCSHKGVPFSQLVFKVGTRLAGLPTTILPPPHLRAEREDALMETFISVPEVGARTSVADDRTLLRSLYGRYRALPDSLTEDQQALVYAALCVARYDQLQHAMNDGIRVDPGDGIAREDVTYFHMATRALANWGRASLIALWALFYLVPYTIGMGGQAETKELLSQWAWQIKSLGLHRRDTANIYQDHEQVGPLFSAYFYTDMFTATFTDMKPSLPFSSIDVDPTPPDQMFPPCLSQSSFFTAKYLADYADTAIDTSSLAYITSTEAMWMPLLRELRHNKPAQLDAPRAKIGWAQFRYNWLRILLYVPHLTNLQLAPQAHATIARAVTQILYTYLDLVSYNQLNPSWPQVSRLVICGHLLILCYEAGELHRREAQVLFQLLIDLLGKHQDTWPMCAELIVGFKAAAQAFDMHIGPEFSMPLDHGSVSSVDNAVPFNTFPYDLGLDFDLTTFPI